ncbi:MAG: molybdopterin-guanine dinucleotide biosynthesis protein B [Candidatus Edwardsbacteria bacterium]|nr:molybdopterin-guanine dinucleotide biosynthesis protein B [Candidatus Edwardsbacteria bacterium]MBU1576366.1 molybdopterin-guanine dinucleotide biosynthesis protein B [Candidatus Edwardsbacteria bacterium]MBU2463208.1 molybdopterin-guanine dinucleotide biosynthesis protein B [Candidatus Edwardsbacteria bacterium]MBU2593543.1 molybdopterin-guanine dinucleotide biosynthesis protein B [Candidatus Edwardsbacteria bacterium]
MQPIISFVGHSNSGKTTLIEQIVRDLARKGYRVGVLKHTHGAIKADKKGTDTDRFRLAGAGISSICDDKLLVRFEKAAGHKPKDIVHALSRELDLLIIEGYKKEHFPKVLFSDQLADADPKGIIATVGKKKPASSKVRHFQPSKISDIAKWLERDIIIPGRKSRQVVIEVDGKRLPLNDFVADIIKETIRGALGTLKGGKGRKIDISIDFGRKI